MKKTILLLVLLFFMPVVHAEGNLTIVSDYIMGYGFNYDSNDINNSLNLTWSGTQAYNAAAIRVGEGNASADMNINSAGYVAVDGANIVPITGGGAAFSVNFWVYQQTHNFIMGFGIYNATPGSMAYFGTSDATTWQFYGYSSGDMTFSSTRNIPLNSLVMATFVYHGNKSMSLYLNGTFEKMATSSVIIQPDKGRFRLGYNHVSSAGTQGNIDGVLIYDRALTADEILAIYNGTSPIPPPVYTPFITQEAFSQEFTQTQTIETSYGEIASATFTVGAPSTLGYFRAGINTFGTQGSTVGTCRILVDGSESATSQRTMTNGVYGNLFVDTPALNLSNGQHNLTAECLRDTGGKYDVVGSTLLGHLLYDANTNGSIPSFNNQSNVTVTATHTNVYNITYTTSTEYQTNTTNALHLLLDWSATPTYASTGNVSYQWILGNENCDSGKRTGSAGSVGSIASTCIFKNKLPNTSYTFQLWANGTANIIDLDTHLVELIQHNSSVTNVTLSRASLNTSAPRLLSSLVLSNVNGGNYDIITGIIFHNTNNGSDSAVTQEYLNFSNNLSRVNNRTASADGSVSNQGIYKVFSASGTSNNTIQVYAGSSNNNSMVLSGTIFSYIVSAATVTPNTFTITAYDYYNATDTFLSFNASVGSINYTTTNGTITAVSTDPTPDVLVWRGGYFENATLGHDRTTNLNASLVRHTRVRSYYSGTLVSNMTINLTNTGTNQSTLYTTSNGNLYLALEKTNTYNLSVSNLSEGTTNYADTWQSQTITTYIKEINITALLSNTFNFTFRDEITESFVNETVTLELISEGSATNYTFNASAGQFNISLLTPSEYTLRYRSPSYTERDYIVTLNNNSFLTFDLYMITIGASSDLLANVENTAGERVGNATITLTRYFVSCNCYKIVEMDRTSSAGQSNFWVQAFDGHYKWSINYLGTNKFLSTSPENIVTDTRFFTIDTGTNYYQSYVALTTTAGVVTYNQSSGVMQFTWSDPNNLVTRGCLTARYVNGTSWDELNACVSGASGTAILTLDNTTRYQYFGRVDTNTDFSSHTLVSGWIDNFNGFFNAYKTLGAFLGASVLMGLSMMFSFSAIAVLVINAVGMLLLGFLGITNITTTFMIGFMTLVVGMSAFLMRR